MEKKPSCGLYVRLATNQEGGPPFTIRLNRKGVLFSENSMIVKRIDKMELVQKFAIINVTGWHGNHKVTKVMNATVFYYNKNVYVRATDIDELNEPLDKENGHKS